jgi:hypothetical protein
MYRVVFGPQRDYLWNTMQSTRSFIASLALLFSMAVFTVSCSKECAEPSTAQEEQGSGKRGGNDASSEGGGQQGTTDPSVQDPKRGNDGTGISDDGDDLSDNERNRKKKVN